MRNAGFHTPTFDDLRPGIKCLLDSTGRAPGANRAWPHRLALTVLPALSIGAMSLAAQLALPFAATFAGAATLSSFAGRVEAATPRKKKRTGCWRGNRRYREGEAYVPDPRLRIGFKGTLVCRGGEWVLLPHAAGPARKGR